MSSSPIQPMSTEAAFPADTTSQGSPPPVPQWAPLLAPPTSGSGRHHTAGPPGSFPTR